jgi:hypothetical protein
VFRTLHSFLALLTLSALVSPTHAQEKPQDPKIVFDLEKPASPDNSHHLEPFGKTCTPLDIKSGEHGDKVPWEKPSSMLELAGAPIDVIKIRRYGPGWKNPDDIRNLITKLLRIHTTEFFSYEPWAEMVFADIIATIQYSDRTEGTLEISSPHVCFSDHSRHALWLRIFQPK